MRLVILSDTHEQHHTITVPDGDVLIHAGDFTYRGFLQAVRDFGSWIGGLPHAHKIVIAGNHDLTFERAPHDARAALKGHRNVNNITYLEDSSVTIAGVHFFGTPWQPAYNQWGFNVERGPQIAKKWKKIPATTDVLISHGPPMGILDYTPDGGHLGCEELLARLALVQPKVHAFGHIHEGSGTVTQNGTTYVNAAICDGNYRPLNPVRVIDL